MARLIIINRMYAGGYLTEGENIGHEIINLIKDDNLENLFLTSNNKSNVFSKTLFLTQLLFFPL